MSHISFILPFYYLALLLSTIYILHITFFGGEIITDKNSPEKIELQIIYGLQRYQHLVCTYGLNLKKVLGETKSK